MIWLRTFWLRLRIRLSPLVSVLYGSDERFCRLLDELRELAPPTCAAMPLMPAWPSIPRPTQPISRTWKRTSWPLGSSSTRATPHGGKPLGTPGSISPTKLNGTGRTWGVASRPSSDSSTGSERLFGSGAVVSSLPVGLNQHDRCQRGTSSLDKNGAVAPFEDEEGQA